MTNLTDTGERTESVDSKDSEVTVDTVEPTELKISAMDRLRRQIQGGKVATVGAPKAVLSSSTGLGTFDDAFLDIGGDGGGDGDRDDDIDNGATPHDLAFMAAPPAPPTPRVNAPQAMIRPGVFTRAVPAPPVLAVPAVPAVSPVSLMPMSVFAPAPAVATAPPATPVPPVLTAQERLRQTAGAANAGAAATSQARREMATMKTLTRMLEAVFARPGSTASEQARMAALSELAINARQLGAAVARVAGDDVDRSSYIAAMATDAAVSLVCQSWENGRSVDWPLLLQSCVDNEEIMSTAESMSYAQSLHFSRIESPEAVTDKLAVSMHAAFWRLIDLGDTVDGMLPKLAANIVRESTLYLQSRERFVTDTTLHVSWMQSSIGRMNNLICAELRARFGGRGVKPTDDEINAVLAVSRSGFEGVENYAQSIIEKFRPVSVDRPSN